jgi:hypothetical protein
MGGPGREVSRGEEPRGDRGENEWWVGQKGEGERKRRWVEEGVGGYG